VLAMSGPRPPSVILSRDPERSEGETAKDLKRSFAVFAAQDDTVFVPQRGWNRALK